ncbi:MAG: DUF4491 family protein [Deltaproteobacteria bacterium]|jgi:hypothetical protein|nr:DUF4491 family protein [Deltaproteobacteria bacterium]MDL1986279.1 DUF4491 family protein [Deltaproteobacteria bacterium]
MALENLKGEYHFGTKWWPVLFFVGSFFILISIFVDNKLLSGSLGIVSFCLFWSIYELFLQKKRVAKGWFPRNPKRDYGIG